MLHSALSLIIISPFFTEQAQNIIRKTLRWSDGEMLHRANARPKSTWGMVKSPSNGRDKASQITENWSLKINEKKEKNSDMSLVQQHFLAPGREITEDRLSANLLCWRQFILEERILKLFSPPHRSSVITRHSFSSSLMLHLLFSLCCSGLVSPCKTEYFP